uniref:SCP domain-containing protein n=1 Tax=Strongyloides papillosus TaxID=174720 RepID=A0A0N5BQ14_STREA
MRIIVITYSITCLFLYLNLTSQWAKFHSQTRYRVEDVRELPTYLCQFEICKRILEMENITVKPTIACREMLKAYKGTGRFFREGSFNYIEVYSKVLTYQTNNKYSGPDKGALFYIGDCVCTNSTCTDFKAVCIYTYWFGEKVWGNHEMC